ncbi:MAG: biosynthetic-type acetolactate synthase large subunit, partial [Methanobacteriaceae archaeon]|nr:biosynthetic-type acetolactate synthase large subunit [Methanobacteriaceae archaeon]
MKGSRAIIQSLTDQGVDVVFGYPGGVLLPLYDEIYDSDLRHILVRHEQCAAHAADGFARASGKVGVCIGTSGPGATNLVTGIATAYMDSSPVVALAGQVASHLIGNDAFQEVDTLGITMPITKHSFQPMDPAEIPPMIKSAFYIASTGRPGPVVLDLPKDVQEAELEYPENITIDLPGYKPTKKGHPLQIKRAAEVMMKAEKPVLLAGGGVILSSSSEEVFKLSKLLGAPVTTTLMGKGCFPEDNPLALGMLGMHGRKVSNFMVDECDCLIAVGCRFSDRTTGDVTKFAPKAKVIHIDVDPAEIGKNVEVDVPIVGDAKIILSHLIRVISQVEDARKEGWVKHVKEFRGSCMPRLSFDDVPLKPQQVIKEIS